MSSRIIATAAKAPDQVITNDDLAKIVDTSDEWIVQRTGIHSRHISNGENTSVFVIDVAKQLKERKAGRVFVCTTFGLFTEGFEKFDEYYEKGYINKVITTNLTYLPAELYKKPYFVKADMSKFLALIIDSLNHDITIGAVMNPTDKIHALLEKYARGEQI